MTSPAQLSHLPVTGAPTAIRQQLGPVDRVSVVLSTLAVKANGVARPAHGIVNRIIKFTLDKMDFDRICSPVSLRGRRRGSFGRRMTPKKGAPLLIPVNFADAGRNTGQAEDTMLAVDRKNAPNPNVLSGFAHRHQDSGNGGTLVNNNEKYKRGGPSKGWRDREQRAVSDICRFSFAGVRTDEMGGITRGTGERPAIARAIPREEITAAVADRC